MHQLNPQHQQQMVLIQQPAYQSVPTSLIESKSQLNVIDELSSALETSTTAAAAAAAQSVTAPTIIRPASKSINIMNNLNELDPENVSFSVGTPPPSSSFKSSSSYTSLNQQFYSPVKSADADVNTTKTQPIPLPTPSLSYDLKAFASTAAGGSSSVNVSSSAESIISDMMREAMGSNPMMQSVYGSLEQRPQTVTKPPANVIFGRKRNTSLTLASPDVQTKRMLNQDVCLNEFTTIANQTDKTLKEKFLNDKEALLRESINESFSLKDALNVPHRPFGLNDGHDDDDDDEKENTSQNDNDLILLKEAANSTGSSLTMNQAEQDENLINLIDSNINLNNNAKNTASNLGNYPHFNFKDMSCHLVFSTKVLI